MNKKGFTLVELLGTIVVLSLVLGIVGLIVTNTIKRAKEKSYQVTIKEVESKANNYLTENNTRLFFLRGEEETDVPGETRKYEYQCVTVRNLIDYGYLDENVRKSEVANKKYVSPDDLIYIERDYKTKAVNEVTYNGGGSGTCKRAILAQGDIIFDIVPSGWSRSKEVTITYKINNMNDVNTTGNYTYLYSYDKEYTPGDDDETSSVRNLTATENEGTITAKIMNGETEIAVGTKKIEYIDLIRPVISSNINQNKVTAKKKVVYPIKVTDNESGVNLTSFNTEDIIVKIGDTTINMNGGVNENYELTNKNNGTYELTINDLLHAGMLTIEIPADSLEDNAGNKNEYKKIEPNIEFDNTYKITLNANGGSVTPSETTVTYNQNYGALPTPTRTGYGFAGWYTSANGGTKVEATTKVSITNNQTLYAHWTANTYTINFDKNGGNTPSPTTKSVTYDGTYGALATTTRTGYTFAGWYTAASGGTKIESSTKVNITANQTLYAHWTANTYTITFDKNGGDNPSSATKTVTYDSTYGTLATISRTGYTFAGWYTSASGGTRIETTTKVSITANQTLYAHWTVNTYTITFSANGGGTPSPTTKTVTYGSTYGTLATISRTGYTFAGWYTSDSGGTKIETSTTVSITSNQTLYAHWTINKYILDVNGNLDGSNSGNVSGFGTFDVYLNGSLTTNDVADYYVELDYGTTYELKDIKAKSGKTYGGISSGSASGTITSATSVYLKFTTNPAPSGSGGGSNNCPNCCPSGCGCGGHCSCYGTCNTGHSGGVCFPAGTKVATINGDIDINKIKIGDYVLTYNEGTGNNEYHKVTNIMAFLPDGRNVYLYTLTSDDGTTINVTDTHRFYITRNGKTLWLPTKELVLGDIIMYDNKGYHHITKITKKLLTETVYNFSVENTHNYYVGEKHILVHNPAGDMYK